MQEYLKDRLWVHLRRAAMAVLASGAVAAATVHANPSSNIVLVLPADLVTVPAHITGQGSVQLSASGRFDFISPLGNQAELVRFRQGQDAVLDLPRLRDPQLKTLPGLTLQDSAFAVDGQDDAPPARDYPVIDMLTAYELGRIFDVKQAQLKGSARAVEHGNGINRTRRESLGLSKGGLDAVNDVCKPLHG
jgi:hypothetical protein